MLENLFKPKSNEELIKARNGSFVLLCFYIVMMFCGVFLSAAVYGDSYGLGVPLLVYFGMMFLIIFQFMVYESISTTLGNNILRQELLSAMRWNFDSEKLTDVKNEIIEEIRTQAFKDGKKVTLRSRK